MSETCSPGNNALYTEPVMRRLQARSERFDTFYATLHIGTPGSVLYGQVIRMHEESIVSVKIESHFSFAHRDK